MFGKLIEVFDEMIVGSKPPITKISKLRVVHPKVSLGGEASSVNSLLNLVKVIDNNADMRLNYINEQLDMLDKRKNELLIERNKISRMVEIARE